MMARMDERQRWPKKADSEATTRAYHGMPTFRFGPGPDGFGRFGHTLNLNWTLGPVRPQCRISDWTCVRFTQVQVRTEVRNRTCGNPTRSAVSSPGIEIIIP